MSSSQHECEGFVTGNLTPGASEDIIITISSGAALRAHRHSGVPALNPWSTKSMEH